MKNIKGLLFDFNGTLFFDTAMQVRGFEKVSLAYGIPRYSEEQLVSTFFGRTKNEIYKRFINSDATDEDCEKFNSDVKHAYFDSCLEMPDRLALADCVVQMLDYVKEQGIPYALVTGSDREEVDFYFEHLGLGRWFSYERNIVYHDSTFPGKPAPDCYIRGAGAIGLAPGECAVFEDGRSGIRAAHAAGCSAVITVHESTVPSPVGDDCTVDGEYHSFASWREILAELGLFEREK